MSRYSLSRENKRTAALTLTVLSLCLGLLLLCPQWTQVLGTAGLLIAFLGYNMRPPDSSATDEKLRLMCQLRQMCVDCLAQHEGDNSQPYQASEYRDLIKIFDRMIQNARTRQPERWRLRNLIKRWQDGKKQLKEWSSRERSKRRFKKWLVTQTGRERLRRLRASSRWRRKQPPEKPTLPQEPRRPFNPYRASLAKHQKEKSQRQQPDNLEETSSNILSQAQEAADSFQQLMEETLPYLQPSALRVEFTVRDELDIPLKSHTQRMLDGAVRLRLLIASTGVILPPVTFGGTSSRLKDSVGLMLRGVEQSSFRILDKAWCPLPNRLLKPPHYRIEGATCVPFEKKSVWPLHTLDSVELVFLQLNKMVVKNLQRLVSRDALLWDIEEPSFPSAHFLKLALQYLRNGRPIPRGSLLELSLQMMGSPDKSPIRLPSESQNLPSFLAAAQTPMPYFQKLDVVILCLSLLGPPQGRRSQRVQAALSRELRGRVAETLRTLESSEDPFVTYLTSLAVSPQWEQNFGPPRNLTTTGNILVERLLVSEPRHTAEPPARLAQSLCQSLAQSDPAWLCTTLLLSHQKERSTRWKVKTMARHSPARLARIIEGFYERPLQRYFMPLQKYAVLCHSLGPDGLELESYLGRFLPPLPSVGYTPSESHQIHLEVLRRVRYWAARGAQTGDI